MIAMALTEMTFDDQMRLSQVRNERLRSFFAQSLLHCVFHHDHQKALNIHCPEAWMVDRLLTDAEELCDYAWLILGVEAIALYFAEEEICRIKHGRFQGASSGLRHTILKRKVSNVSQHVVTGFSPCSHRYLYAEHK